MINSHEFSVMDVLTAASKAPTALMLLNTKLPDNNLLTSKRT